MIRLLPIALLALGVLLALSSFSRADTPLSAAPTDDIVCLEPFEANFVAPERERKSVFCWKKLKTGLLIIPCPADPSLITGSAAIAPPSEAYPCPQDTSLEVSDTEPFLLLPPPRI